MNDRERVGNSEEVNALNETLNYDDLLLRNKVEEGSRVGGND